MVLKLYRCSSLANFEQDQDVDYAWASQALDERMSFGALFTRPRHRQRKSLASKPYTPDDSAFPVSLAFDFHWAGHRLTPSKGITSSRFRHKRIL
jgi:hypothetical protein